jgi:hypothetical protein
MVPHWAMICPSLVSRQRVDRSSPGCSASVSAVRWQSLNAGRLPSSVCPCAAVAGESPLFSDHLYAASPGELRRLESCVAWRAASPGELRRLESCVAWRAASHPGRAHALAVPCFETWNTRQACRPPAPPPALYAPAHAQLIHTASEGQGPPARGRLRGHRAEREGRRRVDASDLGWRRDNPVPAITDCFEREQDYAPLYS